MTKCYWLKPFGSKGFKSSANHPLGTTPYFKSFEPLALPSRFSPLNRRVSITQKIKKAIMFLNIYSLNFMSE